MDGITHIPSPFYSAWSGWVMIALFFCAIFAEYMQAGVITQAHLSLFAHDDRTYKNAPNNIYSQLLINIFRIGSLAMALCICLCTPEHGSFAVFAAFFGLIVAVLLVKMACNVLIDYTFLISNRFMPAYEQYGDIATIASCLLFCCLPFVLRFGKPSIGYWVLIGTTGLFLLMWTYRVLRNYFRSLLAFVYITLYICTLEVLPLGILFYLSSKMITLI